MDTLETFYSIVDKNFVPNEKFYSELLKYYFKVNFERIVKDKDYFYRCIGNLNKINIHNAIVFQKIYKKFLKPNLYFLNSAIKRFGMYNENIKKFL